MKRHLLIILAFLLCVGLQAQKKDKTVQASYARSSLTYLLLDFEGDKYENDIKRAFAQTEVASKYDDNNAFFVNRIVDAPYKRVEKEENMLGIGKKVQIGNADAQDQALLGAISESDMAANVIMNWWQIDAEGNFPKNMGESLIAKRGAYNAKDEDYNVAMAGKRGIAQLTSSGAVLINNSYFLFFDFYKVQSMKEYYDEMEARGLKLLRSKNGFKAEMSATLIKIRFDEEIESVFFDCVSDDGKLDREAFKEKMKSYPDHVQFITKVDVDTEGNQDNDLGDGVKKKTRDELFDELVETAVDKALFEICKAYEPFRVKASVIHKGSQIGAKIGKKEGVKGEQRYFVWRYQAKLDENGKLVDGTYKRKGVVRAKLVVDNRFSSLGDTDTTTFYQVAGGKVRDGYILQQRLDLGFGIAAGYRIGEIGGPNARLTYNASQLLNSLFDFPVTALKLYVDASFQKKEYATGLFDGSSKEDYLFMTIGAGLVKEFYFARNYSIGPYVGYALDWASLSEDGNDLKIYTGMINGGIRLAANVTYNVQLVGGVDYFMPMGKITVDDNGTKTEYDGDWTDIFKDREGLSFSFGLRYQF